MALENTEVLKELMQQREKAINELENMRNTVMRINGAIEVLQQIEASKEEKVTADEWVF